MLKNYFSDFMYKLFGKKETNKQFVLINFYRICIRFVNEYD